MKKLFYLALAILPFAMVSCDTETDGLEEDGNVTVLEGTWYFADSHHPFTFVFSGDTYTFETPGFKDSGTFTYKDGVITCKITQRWTSDTGWEGDVRISVGEWQPTDLDEYTSRRFEVTLLDGGVLIGDMIDEFYGGEPYPMMLVCKGAKITINPAELNGEWLFKVDGKLISRLVVDGINYTIWIANNYSDSSLSATKENGMWSYKDGYLNLNPDSLYYSYTRSASGGGYDYSPVDAETLEAEQWYAAQYELNPYKIPAYSSKGTFYIKLEEGTIARFTKK